jgi:hypothetical protein
MRQAARSIILGLVVASAQAAPQPQPAGGHRLGQMASLEGD